MRYNLLAMKRWKMTGIGLSMAAMLVLALVAGMAGCGGSAASPAEVAQRFVDACNNLDPASLLAVLASAYKQDQGVPDSLTSDQLAKALKPYTRLTMDASQTVSIQGDRAVLILSADSGENTASSGQTLVLAKSEGAWWVDGCTALNWASVAQTGGGSSADRAAIETQLKSFLNACIDSNTNYVFNNLSAGFLADHNLTKPWTASEFSGIFGTARSYNFSPAAISFATADEAKVSVTVEFGSRGNLESESADVVLVREKGIWKVDSFPFFIF